MLSKTPSPPPCSCIPKRVRVTLTLKDLTVCQPRHFYHFIHVLPPSGSSSLQENADDQTASDLAVVLFETATLRSGYQLADTKAYGDRIERMLRLSMNVDLDEQVRHTATGAHTQARTGRHTCTHARRIV